MIVLKIVTCFELSCSLEFTCNDKLFDKLVLFHLRFKNIPNSLKHSEVVMKLKQIKMILFMLLPSSSLRIQTNVNVNCKKSLFIIVLRGFKVSKLFLNWFFRHVRLVFIINQVLHYFFKEEDCVSLCQTERRRGKEQCS
jgi:hypothetical protein